MTSTPEKRVLLRVVNISTELQTVRESGDDPPAPPKQTVQVVLWPLGIHAHDLLGGQKLVLYVHEQSHPLLAELAVDQVFELRPVSTEGA